MTLVPPEDTKRLLKQLTKEYNANLPGSQVETYLHRRGFTSEVLNSFRIGTVSDDPSPAERPYRGMLSIPYITGNGSVVGIKYRHIDDRKPKYLCSLGFEGRRIFNPFILTQQHRRIYITEGELDTVVLHQLGVPAIAIPGATQWSPGAARALRHRQLVVLADGDDSGEGYKLGKQICSVTEDASIVLMQGTDVNGYFLEHGSEKLLEYIGAT
jgi:DNA primase